MPLSQTQGLCFQSSVTYQGCEEIQIDKIYVNKEHFSLRRPIDLLAASIQDVGLISPILVDEDFGLVSGFHRLEAFRHLGRDKIPAFIKSFKVDGVISELREISRIDENLFRNELSFLEKISAISRRRTLYLQIHPEKKRGGAPGAAGGGKKKVENDSSDFFLEMQTILGKDKRTIQQYLQIDKGLSDKVRESVMNLPQADRQKDLLALSKLDTKDQLSTIENWQKELEADCAPCGINGVDKGQIDIKTKDLRRSLSNFFATLKKRKKTVEAAMSRENYEHAVMMRILDEMELELRESLEECRTHFHKFAEDSQQVS